MKRQALNEKQIEAAIATQTEKAKDALLALGTDFDPRVVVITRFGEIRYVSTAADGGTDAIGALARDGIARQCEPVALVHAYWHSDMFGPDTYFQFAVEIRRPKTCVLRVWDTEGFRYDGDSVYFPTPEAAFTDTVWFDLDENQPDSDFGEIWPWTLGPALESVFSASGR